MSKALYLIGAAGLGAAAAIYLFDEKQGKKRRARIKKQLDRTLVVAGEKFDEYSKEMRERIPEFSRQIGARAQDYWKVAGKRAGEFSRNLSDNAAEYTRAFGKNAEDYAKDAGERAVDYAKQGQVRWSPSARFVGAVGSALAFYGAGRRGLFGMFLRTLSLGMFLRALLASR
jgi:gas vesicle protein